MLSKLGAPSFSDTLMNVASYELKFRRTPRATQELLSLSQRVYYTASNFCSRSLSDIISENFGEPEGIVQFYTPTIGKYIATDSDELSGNNVVKFSRSKCTRPRKHSLSWLQRPHNVWSPCRMVWSTEQAPRYSLQYFSTNTCGMQHFYWGACGHRGQSGQSL
jgi:hypothetical protein